MFGLLPSQAAARLGICSKTLQHWSRRGLIRFSRLPSGWRLYDSKDVERIRVKRAKRHSVIDAEAKRAQGF